jgi:hypothetical protein
MNWIIMAAVIVVLFVVLVLVIFFMLKAQARKVNLTQTDSLDQKPEWMRTSPPPETLAAVKEDGEGISLYDYDPGEEVAAPFTEQIEDIAHSLLKEEPALAAVNLDFGTAEDGRLEIWVDGQRYPEVDQVPDEGLRQVIRKAVEIYQNR